MELKGDAGYPYVTSLLSFAYANLHAMHSVLGVVCLSVFFLF